MTRHARRRLRIVVLLTAGCVYGWALAVFLHQFGAPNWLLVVPGLVFLLLVSFVTGLRAVKGSRTGMLSTRSVLVTDAEQRGRELLVRLLTPEQRREYRQTKTITIDIPGGHQAKIGDTFSGVQWHTPRTGRSISQCVAVTSVPRVDDLIGKLLALRTDPQSLADLSGMDIQSDGVRYGLPPRTPRTPPRTSIPNRPEIHTFNSMTSNVTSIPPTSQIVGATRGGCSDQSC